MYLKHHEKQEIPIPSLRFKPQSFVASSFYRINCSQLVPGAISSGLPPLLLWPHAGCGNNGPMPTGMAGVVGRLGFLVVPQTQPVPLKRQVSLHVWSVSQIPSPKYALCFWKLWMENVVKWNNNMCCDDLVLTSWSSQLFTGDSSRGLSHMQGTNVLPSLQTPTVWYGVVLPSLPGSCLCGTASCRTVLYCGVHSLSSTWTKKYSFCVQMVIS